MFFNLDNSRIRKTTLGLLVLLTLILPLGSKGQGAPLPNFGQAGIANYTTSQLQNLSNSDLIQYTQQHITILRQMSIDSVLASQNLMSSLQDLDGEISNRIKNNSLNPNDLSNLQAFKKSLDDEYAIQSDALALQSTSLPNASAADLLNQARLIVLNQNAQNVAQNNPTDPAAQNYAQQTQNNLNNTNAANTAANAKATEANSYCSLWSFSTWPNCIAWVIAWQANLFQGIFIFGGWIAGNIFDFAVYFSIGKPFHDLITSSGVATAWTALRDFSNIVFIFLLLYIALGIIFDIKKVNVSKTIVSIIIVALLVNFSGFMVKVTIDASNVIAYEFYSHISQGKTTTQSVFNKSIGWSLFQDLRLDKGLMGPLASSNKPTISMTPTPQGLSPISIIAGTIGNIILIITISFVLLFVSILFVIRSIVLIFVYIFSPLAFISMISPTNKFNFFDKWTESLFKQSFFAAFLLIPLYLVFLIMGNGLNYLTNGTGIDQTIGLLFSQVLLIAMTIACIFIANTMSAAGAGAAKKYAGTINGALARTSGRVIRGANNQTFGRAGRAIAKSGTGQRIANSSFGTSLKRSWNTGTLRTVRTSTAGQVVGNAVRNPLATINRGVASATGGTMLGSTQILGSYKPGDRQKELDQKAKDILSDANKKEKDADKVKYLEGLAGSLQKEQLQAVYKNLSSEDRVKLEMAAQKSGSVLAPRFKEMRESLTEKDRAETMAKYADNIKNLDIKDQVVKLQELKTEDLQRVYSKLSPEERLKASKEAAGSNPQFSAQLGQLEEKIRNESTKKQQKEIDKEEKKQQAEEISNAARERTLESLKTGTVNPKDVMDISPSDITKLGSANLNEGEIMKNLTIRQLAAIKTSDDPTITESIRSTIKEHILKTIKEAEAEEAKATKVAEGGTTVLDSSGRPIEKPATTRAEGKPTKSLEELKRYKTWFERNTDF